MDIDIPPVNYHPLNYPIRPASLKELATTSLALHLWDRNKHQLLDLLTKDISLPAEKFSCTDILQSTLPTPIAEIIDKRILSLRRELRNSYDNFHNKIGVSFDNYITCFNSLTYGPDGKICHERSARNLVTKNELTLSEKYKIACMYWFEEDVRRIWPLVPEHQQLIDPSESPSPFLDPFLSYWRMIMTDGQPQTNFNIRGLFRHNMSLLEICQNWTAFKSVLNTLSVLEQHDALAALRTFDIDLKYVLSKLNEEQSNFVIRTYTNEIISILASDEQCFEYVLRIWDVDRDSIDFARFSRLLRDLCLQADRCEINRDCREKSVTVLAVLLEIWSTAPNALKAQFFDDDSAIKEIFVLASERFIRPAFVFDSSNFVGTRIICYNHDRSFYSRLFSEMPPETRIRVWHNHWHHLARRSQAWFLNGILRLCLVDEDEIKRFVETEMLNLSKIEVIVIAWRRQQLYNEVVYYSNLCSWNEHLALEFRKKFFESIVSLKGVNICNDLLTQLSVQIDRRISNIADAQDAKKIIFYSNVLQKYLKNKLHVALTNEVFHLTECFLHSERSQREKDVLLPHWHKFLIFKTNKVIEHDRWQEFLSWWQNTNDGWPLFKAFLPVDEIVEKMVLEVIPSLELWLGPTSMKRSEPMPLSNSELKEFALVDDFLMSHFENEEKVKRYKWNKILNYKELDGLKNLFSVNNECIVNDVLRWFFNGDLIGISTFKDRLYVEKQKNDE